MVSETVQSYAFLLDPYTQGFKPDDMLCQKIEQIMLARHPELSVLSFHITDPSDPEQINKLYAINRPNFQFKVATEVTTEAEKSGRVTMCLLPSVRRMEAHVPLYNAQGEFVGVLVTVYVFDQLDEGADLYGRSIALMYEAAQMMPENFEELFQPKFSKQLQHASIRRTACAVRRVFCLPAFFIALFRLPCGAFHHAESDYAGACSAPAQCDRACLRWRKCDPFRFLRKLILPV